MFAICKTYPNLRVVDIKVKFVEGVAEVTKAQASKLEGIAERFGISFSETDPREAVEAKARSKRAPKNQPDPDPDPEDSPAGE